MKEINVPFSLYDFFAILFPGIFGLISILLFIDPSLQNINAYWQNLKGLNDLILTLSLIIFCYFVGHIFNTLGHLFVERPTTQFSGWSVNKYLAIHGNVLDKGMRGFVRKEGRLRIPKRIFEYNETGKLKPMGSLIKKCVEATFGKINQDYGYTYRLIQAYVTQFGPESANEAKIFSATAAMYESLTVSYSLIGIALLYGIIIGKTLSNVTIPLIVVSFVLSALCFNSSRRYKRMWVETMYAAFVAVVQSQRNTKKFPTDDPD
jgi:hypothetical protein